MEREREMVIFIMQNPLLILMLMIMGCLVGWPTGCVYCVDAKALEAPARFS